MIPTISTFGCVLIFMLNILISTTVSEIAYNATCNDVATIPSSQCTSTQAYCINNTCLCKDGVYYKESTDSCEIRPTIDSEPVIHDLNSKRFRVDWIGMNLKTTYRMIMNVYDKHHNRKECNQDLRNDFCVMTGLEAGTKYQIEYYIKDINREVPSIHQKLYVYTAPLPPPKPTSWVVYEKNVTLIWGNSNHNCECYILTITPPPSVGNNSVRTPGNEKLHNVTFDNLSGGTLYTVTIKAVAGNNTASITSSHYTKPGEARDLNLTSKTNTSASFTWNAPDVGIVTQYQVTVSSLGPNIGSAEQNYSDTTDVTRVDMSDLEPGSICKITITTQIVSNQEVISGNPIHIIEWCTNEEGPGKIESLTMTEATSESIIIEWEKPPVRNGVIQHYEIVVSVASRREKNITLNCAKCVIVPGEEDLNTVVQRCSNASVCDNAISDSKFRYNITGLHPFRTYELTVSARTSQRGLKETSYFETEESVPSGTPSFTQHTPTATEVKLMWNPPEYGYRNGIITTYNISYSYMDKTCTDDADGQIKSIDIPLPDNTTSHVITGLDPYTNYSVKIQASTKVGDGPFSDEIQIRTLQSKPSKVRQLNAISESSESFLLNWVVPCRSNGEITYYTIFLTNTDNNAEWNITSTDTSINVTENILPYSNYSINVIGNTVVGEGDKTDNIKVTTSVGNVTTKQAIMDSNNSSPITAGMMSAIIVALVVVVAAIVVTVVLVVRRKQKFCFVKSQYEDVQSQNLTDADDLTLVQNSADNVSSRRRYTQMLPNGWQTDQSNSMYEDIHTSSDTVPDSITEEVGSDEVIYTEIGTQI